MDNRIRQVPDADWKTDLQFQIFNTSSSDMKSLLGEPTEEGDGKVTMYWAVESHDGRKIAVWDWKGGATVSRWSAWGDLSLAGDLFNPNNILTEGY